MAKGYLSLVLHAHLPYVRHPEHEDFFEERWLFEALTECYLPLIRMFDRLLDEGVRFRITVSLSPTLLAMLRDDLLQQRYLRHLARLTELASKEIERTRGDERTCRLARMYHRLFSEAREAFEERYRCDIVAAFAKFRDAGILEIMTTTATHGFLPLLKTHSVAVHAQVLAGAACYRATFGGEPQGIWLPECAFYPGLEDVLAGGGFRHFIVDTHGILNANNRPHYGLYAPLGCPNGVAAFGRDPESSRQVWSAHEGYPGDFDYREFHRDIGYDLDLGYLGPYILDGTTRISTGIKYHRVTGKTENKDLYDPDRAREKAALHADDFVSNRCRQIEHHAGRMDRPPIVVAPYDAELFGHWWFEGPQFLERVIRRIARGQDPVELVSLGDYLDRHPVLQRSTPSASSWGWQGYNDCWINGTNEWIYPYLHHAAGVLGGLAARHRDEPAGTLRERALNQAVRSLFLAQSSDWPFMMRSGTSVDYAQRRVRDYLARCNYLCSAVVRGDLDERKLRALEFLDRIFPYADFRWFAGEGAPESVREINAPLPHSERSDATAN